MIRYENGEAFCENVSIARLAAEAGTPLYVYSKAQLTESADRLLDAFAGHPTLACFAVKANGNLTLLNEIFTRGFGADVVSVGELERALRAGARPDAIVFSGVGKLALEMQRALNVGILSFNVESSAELAQLAGIARALDRVAPVSLRINPDIDAHTHPKIATGLHCTKFGLPEREAMALLPHIAADPHLRLVGLACHIGSQITEPGPFREAAGRMASLAVEARRMGHTLELLNLGGGLGVRYRDETPPSPGDYAEALLSAVRSTGLRLVIEPGRSVVAACGSLVTRVVVTKAMPERHFVVVDAAMTDLLRPALYGAWHPIVPAREAPASLRADVVGPVCETGDVLGEDRELPAVAPGDLLIVGAAGAYGSSMTSTYNARPRPAEVLVDGASFRVIRRREKPEALWADEE